MRCSRKSKGYVLRAGAFARSLIFQLWEINREHLPRVYHYLRLCDPNELRGVCS